MSNKGKLFVLSGSSGGGKTTIIKRILDEKKDFVFSVSSTTREQRNHEIDGKDYHFLSHAEFQKRLDEGKFLEWAEVHGEYYGTEREQVEEFLNEGKNVIFDLDVYGAESLSRQYPEAILIFIHPPSIEELRKRLENRGTNTPEQIERRLSRYPFEWERSKKYPHHVLNDNLEETVHKVMEIIDEKLKQSDG